MSTCPEVHVEEVTLTQLRANLASILNTAREGGSVIIKPGMGREEPTLRISPITRGGLTIEQRLRERADKFARERDTARTELANAEHDRAQLRTKYDDQINVTKELREQLEALENHAAEMRDLRAELAKANYDLTQTRKDLEAATVALANAHTTITTEREKFGRRYDKLAQERDETKRILKAIRKDESALRRELAQIKNAPPPRTTRTTRNQPTPPPPSDLASAITREIAVRLDDQLRCLQYVHYTYDSITNPTLTRKDLTQRWAKRTGTIPHPAWEVAFAAAVVEGFRATKCPPPAWATKAAQSKTWHQPIGNRRIAPADAVDLLWRHQVKVSRKAWDSVTKPQERKHV